MKLHDIKNKEPGLCSPVKIEGCYFFTFHKCTKNYDKHTKYIVTVDYPATHPSEYTAQLIQHIRTQNRLGLAQEYVRQI